MRAGKVEAQRVNITSFNIPRRMPSAARLTQKIMIPCLHDRMLVSAPCRGGKYYTAHAGTQVAPGTATPKS
jgi:hypothetical protein